MKYSKDLLKKRKKSKVNMAFGLFVIFIAITWIPLHLIEKVSISGFDWPYMFIFLLNGLSLFMTGYGYSLDRIIGKAFIEIDNQVIRMKTDIFDKEKSISWDNINSIEYKPSKFIVAKKDKTKLILTISKLEYIEIQEIKNVISDIANKKKISINLN